MNSPSRTRTYDLAVNPPSADSRYQLSSRGSGFQPPADRRRDFTVNALCLYPLPLAREHFPGVEGWVIDLEDGVRDLEAKTIRAVGDNERPKSTTLIAPTSPRESQSVVHNFPE